MTTINMIGLGLAIVIAFWSAYNHKTYLKEKRKHEDGVKDLRL